MKESDIQRKIIRYIDSIGGYCLKVIQASKAGVPDVVACVDGRFFGIEVKMPKGRVSQLQEYNLKKINESGGVGVVARSVEDVKDAVEDNR